uniref:Uncharacterized protein n=1 Tax=Strombidium inclinatum TaxID=197538 RepID=A0A7S3ISX8_9SPIT|mmetsp:Transcript_38473/g.58559  ORF Transcript_38473/g.58559 Transcript_38473/m.58559 type:complete len:137 (+) Transcript_38473:345-755(+)
MRDFLFDFDFFLEEVVFHFLNMGNLSVERLEFPLYGRLLVRLVLEPDHHGVDLSLHAVVLECYYYQDAKQNESDNDPWLVQEFLYRSSCFLQDCRPSSILLFVPDMLDDPWVLLRLLWSPTALTLCAELHVVAAAI